MDNDVVAEISTAAEQNAEGKQTLNPVTSTTLKIADQMILILNAIDLIDLDV